MAKKTKTSPPRKPAPKRKAKAVKHTAIKRAAARKKKRIGRKAAKKRETTLEKIENAILVGAAEMDDVAIGLGLLAASAPAPKKRK